MATGRLLWVKGNLQQLGSTHFYSTDAIENFFSMAADLCQARRLAFV
jgi:hypothetical protein